MEIDNDEGEDDQPEVTAESVQQDRDTLGNIVGPPPPLAAATSPIGTKSDCGSNEPTAGPCASCGRRGDGREVGT